MSPDAGRRCTALCVGGDGLACICRLLAPTFLSQCTGRGEGTVRGGMGASPMRIVLILREDWHNPHRGRSLSQRPMPRILRKAPYFRGNPLCGKRGSRPHKTSPAYHPFRNFTLHLHKTPGPTGLHRTSICHETHLFPLRRPSGQPRHPSSTDAGTPAGQLP